MATTNERERIFEALERVRKTSRVNLFKRRDVQRIANNMDENELVMYLEYRKRDYDKLIEDFGEWGGSYLD